MEASPAAQRYRLQAHQFRATAKRTRTEGILRDLEALASPVRRAGRLCRGAGRREPLRRLSVGRAGMSSFMARVWTEQDDRGGPPALSETAPAQHYRALDERFMEMSKTARTDIGAACRGCGWSAGDAALARGGLGR
jgi:hypothetical protein